MNEKVPLQGKSILELGPLEGGHTYMMHEMGAAAITAVEANSRALLKCLIVKEIYKLNRASFLFGDVVKYLEAATKKFDVCVASGILYHMTEPARFLELCANVSDKLFIWSHYAEPAVVKTHPVLSEKIKRTENKSYRGFAYTEFHYEYEDALGWAGFCGGANPFCRWITKEGIFEILRMNGYQYIHVFFDDLHNHPNGPHICLLAEK